jgi:predicted amidohydrolase
MRVALAQIYCGWGEVEANLSKMSDYGELAAKGGADLVLFPELNISGIWKDPKVSDIAETLEGASVGFARRLARRLRVAIGFGFSERAPGKPYNAYAIASPAGELAGVYRKNYIPVLEAPFWRGHSARPVFEVVGVPTAVAICWDNKYPELHEHYSRCGARMLVMPHAWDSDALDEQGQVIDYQSMEEIAAYHKRTGHRVFKTHDQMKKDFFAYVPAVMRTGGFWGFFINQAGRPHDSIQFVGPSFVVNRAGAVVAETDGPEEKMIFAEVEL